MFLVETFSFVRQILRSSNHMNVLRQYHVPEAPTFFPIHYPTASQKEKAPASSLSLTKICDASVSSSNNVESGEFRYHTVRDYRAAYLSGKKTPSDVAENLIAALQGHCKVLRAIVEYDATSIREQAKESTQRFKDKNPRSLLEGIPISVKDQIQVEGLRTSKGLRTSQSTEG